MKASHILNDKERLSLLIENIKEYAIIILDPKGIVTDWNVGAKRILGYTEKEIIGKNFTRFFIHEDRKAKRPEHELVSARYIGKSEDENWLMRKDKTRFWASGVTSPIKDTHGKIIGFSKIVRDKTDKKEQEQQQNDFITIVIHELRTPFTVVKLFREVLRRHLEKENDTKALSYFQKISQTFDQIDDLLKDLSRISKIQREDVDYEKKIFILKDVVRNVIGEIQQTTQQPIVLQGSSAKKVYASVSQITEVITNLLTNAIKYSPEKTEILVRIRATKNEITVTVQDFGIGIDKKSLSRIFDRFYRTPISQEKGIPGFGIGLYLSKQIIDAHKGRFHVKSLLGRGSTFSFTLPIAK